MLVEAFEYLSIPVDTSGKPLVLVDAYEYNWIANDICR